MEKMEKIVEIFCERHANLDSFPLRYGFSFKKNALLNLVYDKQVEQGKKPGSYSVVAEFINPVTKETEKGLFHIMNKFKEGTEDEVMTVIRDLTSKDIKIENELSSVVRSFRIAGELTVKELIKMHPLYINGKIKKHVDLYEYLFQKRSSSEIKNIEKIIAENEKKHVDLIDELEQDIINQDDEIIKLGNKIQDKDKQIYELNEKIKTLNEQRELKDPQELKESYPGVNWNDSKVTSAAFNYFEVSGDFLRIFLLGINTPIKLKNTFIYDYPVALEAAKKLLHGELFEYETKAFNVFSPEKWFSKIISSDGYSTFYGMPMSEMNYDDPMPYPLESGANDVNTTTIEIGVDEVGIFLQNEPEGRSKDEDVLERDIWLSGYSVSGLKKQAYISDTTFKVIYCYRVEGGYFQLTFNHTWRKDMLILYTDKGWFVDTTVKEHGGTEWEEGSTYYNCKVTMTKSKFLPYWLQKK